MGQPVNPTTLCLCENLLLLYLTSKFETEITAKIHIAKAAKH